MSALPAPASTPETEYSQFHAIRNRVKRTLVRSIRAADFLRFYPDADVTFQVRNGAVVRLDVRENVVVKSD